MNTLSLRAGAVLQRRPLFLAAGVLGQTQWFKDLRAVDEFESATTTTTTTTSTSSTTSTTTDKHTKDGRILISTAERAVLLAVSGVSALLHPEVGSNINNFGEASALECVLRSLRDEMLSCAEGRAILRERPQLVAEQLDVEHLRTLPSNTLGAQYASFTADNDARAPVRFIADEELAYVFLRYRQMHDIVHILTGCKVDLAGELPVKAFEFGNTGLPMTALACFAYFKLSDKRKRKVNMLDSFLSGLRARSLISVPWEKMMHRDVEDLRRELEVVL